MVPSVWPRRNGMLPEVTTTLGFHGYQFRLAIELSKTLAQSKHNWFVDFVYVCESLVLFLSLSFVLALESSDESYAVNLISVNEILSISIECTSCKHSFVILWSCGWKTGPPIKVQRQKFYHELNETRLVLCIGTVVTRLMKWPTLGR